MNAAIRGRVDLTRSQSEDRIVALLATQKYLVAHWRGGEPIIDGFGASVWAAQNTARQSGAPPEAELFTQIPGELFVWGSLSGKRITIEHFFTIDN
jgi:hypothetical protein